MAIDKALTPYTPDYTLTPLPEAIKTIRAIQGKLGDIFSGKRILEPCCGGTRKRLPAYPSAFQQLETRSELKIASIHTLDIRDDSRAMEKVDYLHHPIRKNQYQIIIGHPPWALSEAFIRKAMTDVADDGYVILLLKVSMLESKKRKALWENYPPVALFWHSVRMSFVESRARDAVGAVHVVWHKGDKTPDTRFYWI